MGFSYELKLTCKACNWSYGRYTSKYVGEENGSSNKRFFQINVQTVLAFRKIGKRYHPMNVYTLSLMNFPTQISVVTYTKINDLLFNLYRGKLLVKVL